MSPATQKLNSVCGVFSKHCSLKNESRRGFNILESLPAMLFLLLGLLALFIFFPVWDDKVNVIEENVMAEVIAQNYMVALKSFASKNEFSSLKDGALIGFEGLRDWQKGDDPGNVKLVDVKSRKLGDIHEITAEKAPYFGRERENSNGKYLVRILFEDSQDVNGVTYSKFFKITIMPENTGRSYDFYTSIGKE